MDQLDPLYHSWLITAYVCVFVLFRINEVAKINIFVYDANYLSTTLQ